MLSVQVLVTPADKASAGVPFDPLLNRKRIDEVVRQNHPKVVSLREKLCCGMRHLLRQKA
jgi:hypothetical protein